MTQDIGRYAHHFDRERPRDARCYICGGREEHHDKREETANIVMSAEVDKMLQDSTASVCD